MYGQAYLDGGLASIHDFIPFYINVGDIGQLCADLRQVIDTVNVPGVAKSIDYYVNDMAGDYWDQSTSAYSVRALQGLPPPGQIIPARLSQYCQS